MKESIRKKLNNKLVLTALITASFLFGSAFVFYMIGYKYSWSFFDCFYFTITSFTTVGYGEIIDFAKFGTEGKMARTFTMFVNLWGVGTYLFLVSAITETFVKGGIRDFFRRRKVKKEINYTNKHYILCGFGETGLHVAKELYHAYAPFVIIDNKKTIFDDVERELSDDIPVIKGDASEEKVLKEAGIDKAAGIITTLPDDKDNLFVIVTAKSINQNIMIATKCVHESAKNKLKLAGANKVILPAEIGGIRLASELLRPNVTVFLNEMLRDREKNLGIEEIRVQEKMDCAHKTLQESAFRTNVNVLVIAISYKDETGKLKFMYNPPAKFKLEPGMDLIVLGKAIDIAKFKEFI